MRLTEVEWEHYCIQPNIADQTSATPVRELSKTMDAPDLVHLKEMYKLIRFVLSTKDYGLKFELMKNIMKWVLKALSDSDFASDKETRISIFGYIIYFCGFQLPGEAKE